MLELRRPAIYYATIGFARFASPMKSGTGVMANKTENSNLRRLVLDVDKAMQAPSLIEIGRAIEACHGVEACNITVLEVDFETVGTNITIEGERIDYEEIEKAIEDTGAVVHGIDQLVFGTRMLENIARSR